MYTPVTSLARRLRRIGLDRLQGEPAGWKAKDGAPASDQAPWYFAHARGKCSCMGFGKEPVQCWGMTMYDVVIAIVLFVVMIPVMFLVAERYENKKDIEAEEKEHERRQLFDAYPSIGHENRREDGSKS